MAEKKEDIKNKDVEKEESIVDKFEDVMNDVNDDTKSFTEKDINNGKVMAIIAYLGILCLIPYFGEKENKFAKYHAKEGVNLLLISIIGFAALGVLNVIFSVIHLGILISIIEWLFEIIIFALSIVGIINVANGKAKELPIINKFKIIK